jgi:hypothetical protein
MKKRFFNMLWGLNISVRPRTARDGEEVFITISTAAIMKVNGKTIKCMGGGVSTTPTAVSPTREGGTWILFMEKVEFTTTVP